MSGQQIDERLERGLSLVLVVGVFISAALIAAGFAASFAVGWTGSLLGTTSAAAATTDFSGLLPRLLAVQPLAVTQLGLIVLVLTPVVRVAASLLAFAFERDWLYVWVSTAVLALLLISLVLLR
jgi:uncharacterized membrane protein